MVAKAIKKSNSVTGLVVILLLAMGLFSSLFLYLQNQGTSVSVSVDSKYNETYSRLQETQTSLDNNVNDIKDNLDDITEADDAFSVAWNGLKGLGNTLKLTINFVSNAVDTTSAIMLPLDFIPSNIRNLAFIGIIAFIVFLVLSVLKGEPKL